MKRILSYIIIFLSFFSYFKPLVRASGSNTVTLTPSADATIVEGDSTPYGSDSSLIAEKSSDDFKTFLLRFDLGAIASNAKVETATLKLNQNSASGADITLNAYRVTSSWPEGSVSGTAKPNFDSGVVYGSMMIDGNMGVKTFPQNFSSLVEDWLGSSDYNYGLYLESASSDDYMHAFGSRESGTKATLEVTYTIPDEEAPLISDVKVTETTSTTAKINWKTNEEGSSYVEYGESDQLGKVVGTEDLSSDHSVEVTGLASETMYYFKVKSTDKDRNTSESSVSTFTTTENGEVEDEKSDETISDSILPPSNLVLSDEKEDDKSYIVLTWEHSQSEGLSAYRIYRSEEDNFSYVLVTEIGPEKTSYEDREVEEGKTYYYVVRSVIGQEESHDSNEESIKIYGSGLEESLGGMSFWKGFLYFNLITVPIFAVWYFLRKKKKASKTSKLKFKSSRKKR